MLKEYEIRKALVALVCVKKYDSEQMVDLAAAATDRKRLKKLCSEEFGFEVRSLDQDRVTESDFNDFIFSVRNELYQNANEYDAFIFSFTGHGYRDSICLSDNQVFDRMDLCKWFNGKNCRAFKNKPKILLLQACKGLQDAPNINKQEIISMTGMNSGPESMPVAPDDNIIIFESNIDGYSSYMDYNGGFMVQSFIKVMQRKQERIPLYRIKLLMEIEMKQVNKKYDSVETFVRKEQGVKDVIYFCKASGSK